MKPDFFSSKKKTHTKIKNEHRLSPDCDLPESQAVRGDDLGRRRRHHADAVRRHNRPRPTPRPRGQLPRPDRRPQPRDGRDDACDGME